MTHGVTASKVDHHGVHPPGCRCGKCWKARNEQLAARLAQRDGGGGAAGSKKASAVGSKKRDESFGVVGAAMVPLKTPHDIARLARTVELTRTAASHNLNA